MSDFESSREYLLEDYRARINRVIDYIESNVGSDLTLDKLASVANFSKFHFHRIFFSFVEETLFRFIQRIRVEKAAFLLLADPGKSVTEIAYECGFENPSSFARSFKNHFGVSATDWRKTKPGPGGNPGKTESNQRQAHGNRRQATAPPSMYAEYTGKSQIWRVVVMNNETRTVEVKELPETTVAYVRYVGPYKGDVQLFDRLFGKLCGWAGARNLLNRETKAIIIYHDNPEITEENKLRMSVCVTVPEGTPVDGEIGKMAIPGGRYALARFELAGDEFQEAWNWVYGTWLPSSGYIPDDRPCFELYHGDCNSNPNGKFILDICVPVKPR
ncbi:MAG: AraC family transcriptional regulator [Bacillota bacterium]